MSARVVARAFASFLSTFWLKLLISASNVGCNSYETPDTIVESSSTVVESSVLLALSFLLPQLTIAKAAKAIVKKCDFFIIIESLSWYC